MRMLRRGKGRRYNANKQHNLACKLVFPIRSCKPIVLFRGEEKHRRTKPQQVLHRSNVQFIPPFSHGHNKCQSRIAAFPEAK